MHRLRLTVALAATIGSLAFAAPAVATPAPSTSNAVVTGDGGGHRWRGHHRFGRFGRFPVVSPFLFGSFDRFHRFDSFGGGCDIFLYTGDINSYILCRVG